ncbi:MAG: hypothetical protein IKD73_05245 [Selenomonadaceae bacterium]|nr:hypothetical protein [Selenomonadaceae bacterium]
MMRIINIFRHNFLKKIIALIAAFFMWVFVMDDQDPAINGSYTVPLTMSNVPYEFFTICDVKTVQLDARAARSKFVKYDANAFRVYANLEGLSEGDHQVSLQVVMPQGFELIETRPSTVNVKLDPLTERQMPVELETKGNVASDAAIRYVQKSMDFVTIVGPKSFVEQAAKVYGTVNLSDNKSSFETQIPMNVIDEHNNVIKRVRVVPSVITVSFEIENGLKKRIVPIVPELSVADGWELSKISVEPAQMEISGAESVIDPILTLKTVPFTVQTGQRMFKSTLKLIVPEGVNVPENEVTVSAEVIRKPIMRDQLSN